MERFRSSKPLPREKRSHLTERNLRQNRSSTEESYSDEEATTTKSDDMDENKEIASLKQRLNSLREKMFHLDTPEANQMPSQVIQSAKPPVQPFKIYKKHLPAYQLNNSSENFSAASSFRLKEDEYLSKQPLNIESLDLKAKYLIERRYFLSGSCGFDRVLF